MKLRKPPTDLDRTALQQSRDMVASAFGMLLSGDTAGALEAVKSAILLDPSLAEVQQLVGAVLKKSPDMAEYMRQAGETLASLPGSAEGIRELRQQLGMSQRKLAAELGVAASAISAWETGLRRPPASLMTKLMALTSKYMCEAMPAIPTADDIRSLRDMLGMPQWALAELLGTSQGNLSNMEAGKAAMSVTIASRFYAIREQHRPRASTG